MSWLRTSYPWVRALGLVILTVLIAILCTSNVAIAGPRGPGNHGKHGQEFAQITRWMKAEGFVPADEEPMLNAKGGPEYLKYDCQWYGGSFVGFPKFYVYVYFNERGKLDAFTANRGRSDYENGVHLQDQFVTRLKESFKRWSK